MGNEETLFSFHLDSCHLFENRFISPHEQPGAGRVYKRPRGNTTADTIQMPTEKYNMLFEQIQFVFRSNTIL